MQREKTKEELKEEWEDFDLNNPTGAGDRDWDNLSEEYENMLMAKTEVKSEAFLILKRCQCGLLAWGIILRSYLSTSGMGISARMGRFMSPIPVIMEEEVMATIEAWEDERRELVALGEIDLPPSWRIQGLKTIVSKIDRMRDEIEKLEARNLGEDKEALFKMMRDYTMTLSRTKMLESRDREPTPMVDDMEVDSMNRVRKPAQGINMGGAQSPANGGAAMAMGKGGPGIVYTTPFWGECKGCGLRGHSQTSCPDQGKGFDGDCQICGIRGHQANLCPQLWEAKGKGKQGPSKGAKGYSKGAQYQGKGKGGFGGKPAYAVEEVGIDFGGGDDPSATAAPDIPAHATEPWGNEQQWYMGYEQQGFYQPHGNEQDYGTYLVEYGPGEFEKLQNSKAQVCGVSKEGAQGPDNEWTRIEAIVDSGASVTIMGKGVMPEGKIRETDASREKQEYRAANGGKITNVGSCDIKGFSSEGIPINLTAQVGHKMPNKLLLSLQAAVKEGNMIVFGANREALRALAQSPSMAENVIMNKRSGLMSKMSQRDGVYKYDIWTRREKPKEHVNQKMQVDRVDRVVSHKNSPKKSANKFDDEWWDIFG